jgi:hypothetical protein
MYSFYKNWVMNATYIIYAFYSGRRIGGDQDAHLD